MAGAEKSNRESAFTEKMDKIVTNGYLSLTLAIGAQMGLFDTMATMDTPATAAEVAEKAGCKERYVREWLCAMSVDGIVTVSEDGERFLLPVEHRKGVTDPEHMVGAMSKYIPLLAQAHLPLIKAFSKDGPTGFDYTYTSPMLKEWEKDAPERMAGTIPLLIEQIPGMQEKLEAGAAVCEIGCSRGHSLAWLSKTFPKSSFTGIEVCAETAKEAEERFTSEGVTNVKIIVADAAEMPSDLTQKFDLVLLIDVYHDIPYVSKATTEFNRVLKPGGVLSICDPLANENPSENRGHDMLNLLYPFSFYYCLGTSMNAAGSEALGTCCGQQRARRIIEGAGFKDMEVKVILEEQAHYIAIKPK